MLTTTKIHHRLRWLNQKLNPPKVAIIGGYHGGNLGDMALGMSVNEALNSKNLSSKLQTIYNLEKWPKSDFAIIGGGAIGYNDSLNKVFNRYKEDFSKIAFIGVDFNETCYPSNILTMLSEAAYVSCRSKTQAEKMRVACGRDNIDYHPDIAYSLAAKFCDTSRNVRGKRKRLLVNVVPLYGSYKKGIVTPLKQYQDERPELFKNFDVMHESYSYGIRFAVQEAIDNGYSVETIPFTPQDEAFGRYLLRGLKVKHHSYHDNPFKMLKNMSGADTVIPTRLHATIFAIKTGANIRPIAYATKNVQMLEEAGISAASFLTSGDLANKNSTLPAPIKIDARLVAKWEAQAKSKIDECINSLIQH